MNTVDVHKDQSRNIVHPQKFVVWLLIVSVVMLFAALTSAYIVRRGEGDDWIPHQLPQLFTYSTLVALISSVTMHFAVLNHRKQKYSQASLFISVTLGLGLLFTVMQVMGGYQWLTVEKVYFSGPSSTPRAQFVYLLALTHLLHIALALVFIVILFIKSINNIRKDSFPIWLSNSAVFWHFLGLLWLYLFIFLRIIP